MAAIYLKHPLHGFKVACGDLEAKMDKSHGWVEFDPEAEKEPTIEFVLDKPEIPSFLSAPEEAAPKPRGKSK